MLKITDLKFAPVLEKDGNQFISLMNKTYNRKKNFDYFQWRYMESHLNTVLMGVFLDEVLIGCFGMQCVKLNNGLVGGQTLDLIVDEKFRGMGIAEQMGKELINCFPYKFDFSYGLANPMGRKALKKLLGLDYIETIRTMTVENFIEKNNKSYQIEIEEFNTFSFKDNQKAGLAPLYFLRSAEDIKWRFGKNPEYSYYIIKLEDAFSIVKIFIDPVTQERFGDIVDFGYLTKDELKLSELFYGSLRFLKEKGVKKTTMWALPGNFLYDISKKIGFTETNQERYFVLAVFKELDKNKYLYDIKNWFLVESDAEIY
ncbi:MAG: hypothetical protein PHX21_09060 [bacterium]|nr:hypothetical protein [bacterium]